MKNSSKTSVVAGIGLIILAAVFSVSLLLVLFDFGRTNPAAQSFLLRAGKMLTGVYGLCSVLIPVFLIVAASQCFTESWSIKRGVLLLGSVFPFFTLDALEHICRIIIANNTDSVLGIKLTTALLIGLVIVAIEYALIAMLGDTLQNMLGGAQTTEDDDEEFDEDTEVMVHEDVEEDELEEDANDSPVVEKSYDDDEEIELKDGEYIESEELYEEDDPAVSETVSPSEENSTVDSESDADEATEEPVEKDISKLDSGEDNPFMHVFDDKPTEDFESCPESVEENAAEGPVDTEMTVEQAIAESESSDESLTDAEKSAEDEDTAPAAEPYIPLGRPVPQYNENAFFPEPEEDTGELLELDTFNPEEDSYRGMVTPKEEIPEEVEPLGKESDEEIMSSFDDASDDELDTSFDTDAFESESNEQEENYDEDNSSVDEMDEFSFDDESLFSEDNAEEESQPNEPDELDLIAQSAEAHRLADQLEAEAEFDNETAFDDEEEEPAAFEEEQPKSGLDAIFAEMDDDAANDPVFDDEGEITVPVPNNGIQSVNEQTTAVPEAQNLDSENVDPLAPPVVDSNGNPIETAAPIDFEDISLEEMERDVDDVPVVQVEEDEFNENDVNVVRLEKPAPLVEEPPAPPKKKLRGPYRVPSDLLETYSNSEYWLIDEETKQAASDLKETLSEFKIEAEVTGIRKGPVVTMFEILPAPGVKLSKIVALQDNIALRLAASSVRIVAPIPGKHAVGIEVPNKERAVVGFKEIVDLDLPQFSKMAIPVILGKDISGEPQVLDLAKTPHLLIAGSTGAGKSVCVNSMILSILYKRSPQDVKLIMIDPKVVELKLYNDIPHLLTPVITESKKAFQSLQYCLCEMERRYACLDGMGVRDISSYNKRIVERNIAAEKLPYIVVIIDEFADLMATTGKELESTIARLAAMSRAVGIHLVLATQRPSIDVITGLIKANIPSRIAFMVASKMDSRIIIDQVGAEKLLGKGDMLYASATDPFPVRIQGTLVNDNEVESVVNYVKQYGEPEYIDDEIFVDDDDEGGTGPGLFSDGEDPLYDEALQIVVQQGKASASYIQRRLKIGYNRAARLVEEMEERGIVGPANGSKPREVIHVPS